MLDAYATEPIGWKKKTGTEFNGRTKLDVSETIYGRVVYKRKIVKNSSGKEVVSEITVYTETEVNAEDYLTIDGKDIEVIASSPKKDIDSVEIFREVVL
jgi:hypothetical protein